MANYVLEILDGDRAGEVLSVGDSVLRIGRKAGNDLVLADEKTSGVHCELTPDAGRLVLKDLGSTNGTFLDGKRIDEVVLTPGDVITVGRLRVRFGAAGEPSAAADDASDEFSLRKLDAARLQKRGSPVGLLLVLLVVLGGGGGYWWWMQQGAPGTQGAGVAPQRRQAMSVAGNRLPDEAGSCESDLGWILKAGGVGFRATGDAHTGSGGFSAYREAAEDGAVSAAGASDAGFAVLKLEEAIQVFAGRTLTVAAHGRTLGAGLVGVRVVAFAANEESPFRFVSGTKLVACDGWQRLEATVTVPDGCDQLRVEAVGILPDAESEAHVDDISVVDGGDANDLKIKLDSGLTAFGFGGALAVRSADPESPATVIGLAPGDVPEALQGLMDAGQCFLSDVGSAVSVAGEQDGYRIEASEVGSLAFVLPADSGAGLMAAAADAGFASKPASSEFRASRVLFGSFGTRALLRFDEDTLVRGLNRDGDYILSCAASKASLVVGFRGARQRAAASVRSAQSAVAEGSPGQALGILDELVAEWPMDSAELGRAQQLRAQVLAGQAASARQLQRDFEQAGFFDTRGGYERVLEGVDEILALYGEANVEDLAALEALREKASARLLAFDRTTYSEQRERLQALAAAFGAVSEAALQKMVEDYISKHLPPVEEAGGDDGQGGRD
ncbi:MAG: FHA domain-containing protein [Planctomycetota bacterium]|nr:FHA domain-containing protein [Planctomycetota bacterium]